LTPARQAKIDETGSALVAAFHLRANAFKFPII
jgi:hypothetical protein